MTRSKKLSALSALVIGAIVAAAPPVGAAADGAANVTADAPRGVLCANRQTSNVRYSNTGRCRARTERRLAFGLVGPAGPAGPVGAAGSYATAQGIVTVTTTNYTLTAADAGKMIVSTVDAVITVPNDASVAFPVGTRIDLGRLTSYIFVQGATGVKVNGSSEALGFDSVAYQHGLLVKTAANNWVLLRFFP